MLFVNVGEGTFSIPVMTVTLCTLLLMLFIVYVGEFVVFISRFDSHANSDANSDVELIT